MEIWDFLFSDSVNQVKEKLSCKLQLWDLDSPAAVLSSGEGAGFCCKQKTHLVATNEHSSYIIGWHWHFLRIYQKKHVMVALS